MEIHSFSRKTRYWVQRSTTQAERSPKFCGIWSNFFHQLWMFTLFIPWISVWNKDNGIISETLHVLVYFTGTCPSTPFSTTSRAAATTSRPSPTSSSTSISAICPGRAFPAPRSLRNASGSSRRSSNSPWTRSAARRPPNLAVSWKYARNLEYEAKPDYNYCRQLFRDMMARDGVEHNDVYDWDAERIPEFWREKERLFEELPALPEDLSARVRAAEQNGRPSYTVKKRKSSKGNFSQSGSTRPRTGQWDWWEAAEEDGLLSVLQRRLQE